MRSIEPGTQGPPQRSVIPWVPDRDFVASGMTSSFSCVGGAGDHIAMDYLHAHRLEGRLGGLALSRYLGDMDSATLIEDEDLFEMVNVRPEISGLPFIVWISEKGGARHDVRVKVSPGPRVREFAATISVRPKVEVLAGELSGADLDLVRQWIDLNRDTIIRYWNGDIMYTDEALAALKPLKKA